ncbi:MAG TPA: YihY/virulence factor BrkB family protein [Solirubrobacterales bacterium]|nr:YihY/virulence factor BrkB family protein [Solirubrobacterales bacterium]
MSTATHVPTTHDLEGDDALGIVREAGLGRLLRDSYIRFRYADGFSHSRALAFQFTLTLVPSLIAIVGLARAAGEPEFGEVVATTLRELAPGPAGDVLGSTIEHGEEDASETALALGSLAALVAGATAMGQIERGSNRIYGVERDRPALAKYSVATFLACSAGVATFAALVLVVAGAELGDAIAGVTGWRDSLDTAWEVGRWPLGALLIATAVTLIFKVSPRRHQPSLSWLALGAGLAVALWIAFTGLLATYLSVSKDFGETYGPLAGLIGLLLWTLLTALALFGGLAVAAQLEAVRAGVKEPAHEP